MPTPSVTTWVRLEPRAGDETLASGLEARVHDPLWMLARQWQTGELRGEDAGSPVSVRFSAGVSRLNRYRGGVAHVPPPEVLQARISERAYFLSRSRSEGSLLVSDWLAAEQEYRAAPVPLVRDAAWFSRVQRAAYFNFVSNRYPGGAFEDWVAAVAEEQSLHDQAHITRLAYQRHRARVLGDWYTAVQQTSAEPAEQVSPYDDRRVPLEALVERERIRPAASAADPRQAAEAGLHFLRLLQVHRVGHYRDAYLSRWPLRPPAPAGDAADARNRRFLDVVTGRVLDGVALYAVLSPALPRSGGGALPANNPPFAETDRANLTAAARAWLAWYDGLFSEPAPGETAWIPERMEYHFAVAAPSTQGPHGEVVLAAREYAEGRLDWHSFDVEVPPAPLGAAQGGTVTTETRVVLPTPVTFGGMPSPRWWEMEDRRVHFGGVEAGPEDLARMLLMEFALIYGNDFFVVPIELEVGSVCRLESLVVTDTFGIRTLVPPHQPGSGAAWRMWALSGSAAAGPVFFLPPVLGSTLNGAPHEEVLFLRDEMANLAWAVERRVQGPAGLPAPLNPLAEGAAPAAEDRLVVPESGRLVYRLASPVPRNWHPLVPVRMADGRSMRLQRRTLASAATGQPALPLGRLLAEAGDALLHEEEVPREGASVTRAFQLARWADGSTHLWMGRRKGPGRGEAGSGLRFDAVAGPPEG